MKALRTLRALTVLSTTSRKARLNPTLFHRFYSAQPQEDDPTTAHDFGTNNSVFDSSQYSVPDIDLHDSDKNSQQPTWDEKYRARADRMIFGEETQKRKLRVAENEDEERRRALAKALLQAALEKADDEVGEGEVKEEYQKSLNVGIIGAPNAGKSSLTNFLVETKVAAVSRKTNTTTHEVLGVMTKGDTQIVLEQRKQPELRGLPTAVVQYNEWKGGALIAVSYEARKYGVKRSMRGDEAKEVCPQVNLVQVPVARGKADLNIYRNAGSEVVSILARKGRCERASIDEVYLDLTDASETMLAEAPPESLKWQSTKNLEFED
ncbi:GTP-binding protein ERG-like [Carica papaya]|uniref:GTP-binding protein ERG-like n=1 Tax=Carica papaya TaxID=3649 RepID=UPI000B8CEBFA|nr:GTP-binding protein ERG-like [Carica papaya]